MLNGIFDTSQSCYEERFIPDYTALADWLVIYRKLHPKAKVGFVSGVWDLIHLGHMAYIEKAKDGVDLLVVGSDTDELTRSRKATDDIDRPIVPFEERSRILSYLRAVDIVTSVGEDFISVLKAVQPDKLVFSKSTKDMNPDNLTEYKKYSAEIIFLEPQAPPDKISTTARVRDLMIKGTQKSREKILRVVNSTFDEIESKL